MDAFKRRPLWYKDAVIYEVHVKCFHDARGDGMGDFRGLIAKLDYLRELGVTAIWILPFYPSPLKDDGYDIADYKAVHPAYGTLADFDEFLAQAHARGLYVITELVINHTSDQHPWFQRARRAAPGSPERDFYVWSDDKERYRDARIIFQDFEPSNWSWDPVAGAFFWHRFYSHQPDLNFDNPAVHAAVLDALDFWLGRGVDGLRLDAVPYLYEREGTNCENLPETHAFLRRLAAHVRERYDHRMLLAEANQWPEDAAAYFGSGDSCHAAFHFPLMPRMYMAVEMEDRFPILDILEQTPAIPPACQWAIFLRNHDELTLEMVTDEERDYMYRVYAKDRRARINLGIRRRLAPLLANNRRKIELMNRLLLSLPGTPVIYYGDEIGMGDNFYLGDRNGVRTPMQWTPDRNAGFSKSNSQQLYLPVIIDPEYHYETVNVETQERNPSSLLWWMRRAIHLRQAHPAFGRGTIRFLSIDNSRILAFLREWQGEAVLVLSNLSEYPQTGQLDLSEFAGCEPLELTGRTRFPPLRQGPYPIMLGSYGSLWLLLRAAGQEPVREEKSLPDLGQFDSLDQLLSGPQCERLESEALLPYVSNASWFEGRSRLLRGVRVQDWVPLGGLLVTVRAVFLDAEPQDYALVLGFVSGREAETLPRSNLLAAMTLGAQAGWLCEAVQAPEVQNALMDQALHAGVIPSRSGKILVEQLSPPEPAEGAASRAIQIQDAGGEEVRIIVPDAYFLRWFRRLREGPQADLEVLTELASQAGFAHVPRCLSVVYHHPAAAEPRMLGYSQRWVAAHRDTAALASEHLGRFLEQALASGLAEKEPEARPPFRIRFQDLPEPMQEHLRGIWGEFAQLVGQRLAELHAALAACRSNPDFTPEPYSLLHQQATYHAIRAPLRRQLTRLAQQADALPAEILPAAMEVAEKEPELLARLKRIIERRIAVDKIRIHGDLGLDRILFTGKDFVFTGFDGEPWRPLPERRFKFSALRDVAALQHALSACAEEGASAAKGLGPGDRKLRPWARHWAELSGALILDSYLEAARGQGFLPRNPEDLPLLLEAFRIERASYELKMHLGNNAERVRAAIEALLRPLRDGAGEATPRSPAVPG